MQADAAVDCFRLPTVIRPPLAYIRLRTQCGRSDLAPYLWQNRVVATLEALQQQGGTVSWFARISRLCRPAAAAPAPHVPLTTDLLNELIYLDREFISNCYQIVTGQSPSTQIQKAQGMKAGASLAPFSAEVSAGETRSFSISTIEMLTDVLKVVKSDPDLEVKDFPFRSRSKTGWVSGEIGMVQIGPTATAEGEQVDRSATTKVYFGLNGASFRLALVTAPDYFASGIDTLRQQFRSPINELVIPVRAYVRVLPAKTYVEAQWVAVPYIVLEQ